MTDEANFLKTETQRLLKESIRDIVRDVRAAGNELTQRIDAFLANPLAVLQNGTGTESGSAIYSSLAYPDAAAGAKAFAERDPHIYARIGHIAASRLVEELKYFDPAIAEGRVLGHGMTAFSAIPDCLVQRRVLTAGDKVVASRFLFSSCRLVIEQLRDHGVEVELIDGRDLKEWERAVTPDTKLAFIETPGNPTMELIDIAAVSDIVHRQSPGLVVVDNSLEFPSQQPLAQGADIAVTSLTKSLGPDLATGAGTDNGGVLLLSKTGIERLQALSGSKDNILFQHIVLRGGTIGARVAIEMLQRLPYLEERFQRQSASAGILAEHIEDKYPHIRVLSPGLASHPQAELAKRQMKGSLVLSVDLGDAASATGFINNLIGVGIDTVNNFGSLRTTTAHPASTTHSSLSEQQRLDQGVTQGLVRVSVGVEDVRHLVKLFDRALTAISPMSAVKTVPEPNAAALAS